MISVCRNIFKQICLSHRFQAIYLSHLFKWDFDIFQLSAIQMSKDLAKTLLRWERRRALSRGENLIRYIHLVYSPWIFPDKFPCLIPCLFWDNLRQKIETIFDIWNISVQNETISDNLRQTVGHSKYITVSDVTNKSICLNKFF